ncbi:MAG: hypothetical protein HPY53_05265 [Brevinematales bacterium]|nr:hypothetical protein [Brevinematales bacterium]
MYRFDGIDLVITIVGLLVLFYFIVWLSPVMILIVILAIIGYGGYLFYRNVKLKRQFNKSAAKFDEKGRVITKATILEMTDDDEQEKTKQG